MGSLGPLPSTSDSDELQSLASSVGHVVLCRNVRARALAEQTPETGLNIMLRLYHAVNGLRSSDSQKFPHQERLHRWNFQYVELATDSSKAIHPLPLTPLPQQL